MSLNDYFAANGAVYLRPVGLPDCFPLPGLPHGCKPPPPPLAMQQQHPCAPQKPRTMATVSPLHQGGPAPYETGFGPPSSRTSSFAAALRKLAKQAGDPVVGEKELAPISPVSSPALNQGGSLTPKRSGAPMGFLGTQYPSSSPPVVTIAPSRPVATHTSESRKVMDLSSVPPSNNTAGGLTNGHLPESLAVKMDAGKAPGRPQEKWDEKGPSSAQPQVRPHATIAPLPRPDDSLTSSRGFQPYRGSEESRNTLPHHLPLFEHHPAASYPYGPTFLPPPHLTHPAYRFDDPLYLERYSLLRPPVMPYPQAGMMAPPPAAFYPNSRYAADLIAQSMSLNSANNSIINERIKQEEERRMREKEFELDQSRSKEQERQREQKETREREKREKSIREKEDNANEHKKSFSNSSHSSSSAPKRSESSNARAPSGASSTTGPPNQSTPVSSSIPLNLVMHPSQELPKKETELWLPWQQPPNPFPKDSAGQEMGSNSKHPAYRAQENQRHVNTKDHQVNEKVSSRFSPPIPNDKKHSNTSNAVPSETENRDHRQKPHSSSESKKYDSIHHHITELSNKESNNTFDWRTHNPNEMQTKDIHPMEWGQHEKVQRTSEAIHKDGNVHDWRPEKQHKSSSDSSSGAHEWRHEKLQKACTNNHRKSHESSKKAKEVLHNHQRKAVNGVVQKPGPYLNEGMHARLLESEKSRLELNGHTQQKPQVYNNVNERLIVPPYKTSFPPVLAKDMGPHKMYTDYYSAPVLKSNVDLTPVVSKLDVDAKRLQKNDLKYFEDEGKEELRLKNLLIITKGPPLKFDPNPQKLKFLQLVGLTTHFKRKKIEFNMYLKRRKILREESNISPWNSDAEDDEKPVLPLSHDSRSLDHLAEKLRSETTPEKLEYFLQLGLTPITLVKKEEKERIRRIVEEEKMKRHYRFLAKINRKASPRRLFVPKNEAAMKLDHLRKMKELNFIPNGLLSKKLVEDDEQLFKFNVSNASQSFAPKYEKVPYMITSEPGDSCGSSFNPSAIVRNDSSCTVLQKKSFNKYSFKRGHSLKNEWRYPDPVGSKNNHIATNKVHGPCLYPPATSSIGTQVDAGVLNSEKGTLASLKDSFNWPGLESVMEAFFRHQNEQSSEKIILTERCQLLRQTQEELKKEAESLSRRMSELLKRKREMDEERLNHQCAIDRLKQCLQFGR